MNEVSAVAVFECLSSPVRLAVYRRLVAEGPEGLVAGEIAAAMGLPPTNLSFHLKALNHADLVSVVAEGRYQRYRANIALMGELVDYLTAECCGGRPEQCLGGSATGQSSAPSEPLEPADDDQAAHTRRRASR